jgi:Flp pilus assembly protein TadD
MAGEDGRIDEARQRYALAFATDPAEAGKLLALAAHLASRGRRDEARALLELFAEQASPALFARELEQVRAVLGAPGPTRAAGR